MGMRIGTELPAFEGATEWLNGSSEEVGELTADQAVLVHFWSLSCGLCKENLPRIAEWREEYSERGLRLVAVHMPRYPSDTEVSAVRAALDEFNITEPCAVDNDHKLRDAFLNEHGYVPAYYLFNTEHKLKGFAAGEHGVKIIEPILKRILPSSQTASVT